MKSCKYCNQEPETIDVCVAAGEGAYAALYMGVDENANLKMYASGENNSDDYYPKFCPECGRKLPYPKKAIEKNGLWIKEY